jgi:hypothetical protein
MGMRAHEHTVNDWGQLHPATVAAQYTATGKYSSTGDSERSTSVTRKRQRDQRGGEKKQIRHTPSTL